ncbi:ricin-type beta-trefoil lectin domain protein [Saccharothrix australiensis]|uniref:D-mannose binding lectin n=1 Tax=Saccharothrix australiensis TaxID=2072 RepID=A0A495VWR4_9PSEU|nr:ricin-type beta-trefoil lectin domain protein [Saccharothrix australiensis]RKT53669.1 D-mannose binding lectin [Saccharothrix australiensis]
MTNRFAGAALGLLVAAGLVAVVPASAVSSGTTVPEGQLTHLAKVELPGKACSGALVGPQWVVTAAGCFAPADGATPPPGTRVVLGAETAEVAGLVRREDRDVVLLELATPVTGATPLGVGAAPEQGTAVKAAGFGRTASEWVPLRPSVAPFTVTATTATTLAMTNADGKDLCKGDAGGPVTREVDGRLELVGVNSTSWQHGCLGETGTRQGSTASRVDDLAGWIKDTVDPSRARFGPVKVGNLCLEVADGRTEEGAAVRIADCAAPGTPRQSFTTGPEGTLRVLGKCLDAAGPVSSWGMKHVRLLTCDGSDQQKWQAGQNRSLVSPWNRFCLDGTANTAGSGVTTNPCHGQANQQWTAPARFARLGSLVGDGGLCLDVTGGNAADGALLRTADCITPAYAPTAARQVVTSAPDGTLRVFDKCLDAGSTTVQLRTCDGTDRQKWTARPDLGYASAVNGRCLDAARDRDATTTECAGGATQRWTPRPVQPIKGGSDRLVRGERLSAGQSKWSPDGRFRLTMQPDGNLVLYAQADGAALWSSVTWGSGATHAILQPDGNLVVYTAAGEAKWHTWTFGTAAERFVVQSDSNIVLYGPDATPYWHRWK